MIGLLEALSSVLNKIDQGVFFIAEDIVLFNSAVLNDLSGEHGLIYLKDSLHRLDTESFCKQFSSENSKDDLQRFLSSPFLGKTLHKTNKNIRELEFYKEGPIKTCIVRQDPFVETSNKLRQAAADVCPLVITGVEFNQDEGKYVPHYVNETYRLWTNNRENIIGKRFPDEADVFKDATIDFANKYRHLDEKKPHDQRCGKRGMEGGSREIVTTIRFAGRSRNNNKLFVNFTEDLSLTQNKVLESEYRNSLMSALLDHSPASLGIIQLTGDSEEIRIVDSDSFQKMTFSTEDAARLANSMIQSREKKSAVSIQLKDSNSHKWSQFSLSHYRDDLFCFVAVDITETKILMSQLHEVKSIFLATMSHEIRTPLSGIIGALSLLANVNMSADDKEVVRIGKVCSQQLLVVINDILDYTKMEDHKMLLESIEFLVSQPINDALEIVSVDAENNNLELIYDVNNNYKIKNKDWEFNPPEGYKILDSFGLGMNQIVGDPTRLRQIIINLLSNAVKFSSAGKIIVRSLAYVKSDPNTDKKTYLCYFSVEDEGIGIDSEDMNKLFHPFSQVDVSVTRKFGGTGLGLSISKKLCEIMGGTMWCTSKVDHGSTFHFTISTPEIKTEQKESSLPLNQIDSSQTKSWYSTLKVLVAEDNLLNQKIISRVMKMIGITDIKIVNNGMEAFDEVRTQKYHIVFMDVMMPVLSGIDATKKIRTEVHDAEPIIIGLSADAFKENEDNCRAAGMAGFLTKPIIINDLIKTLETYCINK